MLDALEPPWPDVFSLMWDAYSAGTIPVGAVVVDESGAIVARGRNRIFDDGGERQLGRTYLAHAEINALLAVPRALSGTPLTLYSALEPCHLCLSAAYSTRMAAVRYAAADPYGGAVGKLLPSRDHEVHPVEISGPLPGTAGLLPELLHVAHMLWRVPDGNVVTLYRTTRPQLVEAAQRLPLPDAGAALADAVEALASSSNGPADVSIRPADATDVIEIEAIVRDAYAIYVPRIGREPAPMTADYRRLIEAGDVWVAETGEELAGVLVVRPQESSLLLENVAVASRHQGTGIGRALIAFAEARARQLGLSEVTLYTNERMKENLRLYASLGYRETGRHREEGFARVFFAKRVG